MKTPAEWQKLEQIVLSHILNNPKLYIDNVDVFNRVNFRNNLNCGKVFETYKTILAEGNEPDIISLCSRSGVALTEITEMYASLDFQFDFHNTVNELIQQDLRQNLLSLSIQVQKMLSDDEDPLNIVCKIKDFIANSSTLPLKRIRRINEHVINLIESIDRRKMKSTIGLRTGLTRWDMHTGGLQASDLIVIAAMTSNGKTSLALTIAYNATTLYSGVVAIFSLEMSSEQITARLTSMETGISSKKILFQPLLRDDSERIANMKHLPESAIYIDECSNSSIDYILNGIRLATMRFGIQVAIVDYLQLIRDNTKRNEETEISSNTRKLKNIAKELGITIILLSQLSRDQNNPKPTLSRLRGSGQIEEAADIVALLWRPEIYKIDTYEDSPLPNTYNTAEIIFAKGRNIGIGRMWLNFNPILTQFTDCEYETKQQPERSF